jgi:hypothetical protein
MIGPGRLLLVVPHVYAASGGVAQSFNPSTSKLCIQGKIFSKILKIVILFT